MRVLLVHPHRSVGSWEDSLVRTFRHLGDTTASVDYRRLLGSSLVTRGARGVGIYGPLLQRHLTRAVRRFRADMIFVSKGELITPEVLNSLRRLGIPVVNWIGDGTWELDFIRKVAPCYDHFFTFDRETVRQLSQLGIDRGRYLPFGFDTLLDRSFAPEDPDYYRSDVCFVGTPTPDRLELFQSVDWRGIKLKIWGSTSWEKTRFAEYYMGRPLVGAEMYFAYANTKIVINVHYGFKIANCPHYTGINHRVFETGGIGAFSLVNHQGDMDTTFEARLPTFEDYADLASKIGHFLQSTGEAARFTDDFQREILARHTLLDRVRELKRVAMA